MREEFRAELGEVNHMLVAMASAVREAMSQATTALMTANKAIADLVVARDAEIDAMYRLLEEKVYDVLARQAPVASDLRMLVTALHVGGDLERMGDLAEHVGRAVLRRHPAQVVPAGVVVVFEEMGQVADRIAERITTALSNADAALAAQLDGDDDVMDELHRKLFQAVLDPAWGDNIEAAVDTTLLSRFYERYADHAVNAGRHLVYFVTGETLSAGGSLPA